MALLFSEIIHHSSMLNDDVRIKAYAQALNQAIGPRDHVVDLGSGTGLLSKLAVNCGAECVSAIEFQDTLAEVTRAALAEVPTPKWGVLNCASTAITVLSNPTILVTETIGQIGPEEKTVESCWDFVRRHPSVQTVIPSKLSIYVQPIISAEIDHARMIRLSPILALIQAPSAKAVRDTISQSFHRTIQQTILIDTQAAAESTELATYRLGVDFVSGFCRTVSVPAAANALHFYFNASLYADVSLSSHFSRPITHWKHSFLPLPSSRPSALEISYRAGAANFELKHV